MTTTTKVKMRKLTLERKKKFKIQKNLKQPPPKQIKKKQKGYYRLYKYLIVIK